MPLEKALQTGYALLLEGKSSSRVVVAAVQVMEDTPLFNAGKGAVFTHNGTIELDGNIMEGVGRRAGAVTGVQCVKKSGFWRVGSIERWQIYLVIRAKVLDFLRKKKICK